MQSNHFDLAFLTDDHLKGADQLMRQANGGVTGSCRPIAVGGVTSYLRRLHCSSSLALDAVARATNCSTESRRPAGNGPMSRSSSILIARFPSTSARSLSPSSRYWRARSYSRRAIDGRKLRLLFRSCAIASGVDRAGSS